MYNSTGKNITELMINERKKQNNFAILINLYSTKQDVRMFHSSKQLHTQVQFELYVLIEKH